MCLATESNFILILMTTFHMISLVTEAIILLLPRGKTNPYANNVCSAQFKSFDGKLLIYTLIKIQELLFYSEPCFNVAAVIGTAKLGVSQLRHVLASWDQRWIHDKNTRTDRTIYVKCCMGLLQENLFKYDWKLVSLLHNSIVALLLFIILSNI